MLNFFDFYIASTVFVFGAIIGSFLNVVIYRFHTGRSLSGDSHCLSCLRPLRWFELFPLFSYLSLRGKCRSCRSYIPPRYFVVELLTALFFLLAFESGNTIMEMFLLGSLFAVFVVISVYDIYHFIIPDELTIITTVLAIAIFVESVFSGGEWMNVWGAIGAGLGAFLFYGGLWKVSSGRWLGFGDAKLAIPLGFMAGWPGVFSMIVLSFWVGAAFSLVLLGLQKLLSRGQIRLKFFGTPLKMKSEVPFAPFLIVGFILSYVFAVDVLELVSYVL